MNYISKYVLIALLALLIVKIPGNAQTCCSGGVPLSGNIGFQGASSGTLQMELSYDLNYLSTLKSGSIKYREETRQRSTHSILLKTGYSFNSWFAVDALFTYVFQERKISLDDQINLDNTLGPGDMVLMAKFVLLNFSKTGTELQLGMGPKVPLGRTDLTNSSGIVLNADMQPGSGSWDLIGWFYYARQFVRRPTMTISARIVGRLNGNNREYSGSQNYRFGNSAQLFLGVGDQLVWDTINTKLQVSNRILPLHQYD
jgi:hypothetical protein